MKVEAYKDVLDLFSLPEGEIKDSGTPKEDEEVKLDRFEKFNQEFFKAVPESINFIYLNRAVLYRLDGNIVVQITLYAGETVNQDFGYDVEIISKKTGRITEKRFPFALYLRGESLSKIEVKEGSWIRCEPGTEGVDKLANKIMEYIDLWK